MSKLYETIKTTKINSNLDALPVENPVIESPIVEIPKNLYAAITTNIPTSKATIDTTPNSKTFGHSMINRLYQLIVPEKPSILAEERILVYAPQVTKDTPGIAKFSKSQFTIINGEVSIKRQYLADSPISGSSTSTTSAQDNPPDPNYVNTWVDTNTNVVGFKPYDDVFEDNQVLYEKEDPTPEEIPDTDTIYSPFIPTEPLIDSTNIYELESTGYDQDGNYTGHY